MTFFEVLRFIVGALLVLGGLFVTVTGVIGNFKFRYVLSRMHAAGLGDTLGLLLTMLGLIVLTGFSAFAIKLLVIVVIFWTASPVASHMIMKMEIENGSGAAGSEKTEKEKTQSEKINAEKTASKKTPSEIVEAEKTVAIKFASAMSESEKIEKEGGAEE